jgi:hypothetical protein
MKKPRARRKGAHKGFKEGEYFFISSENREKAGVRYSESKYGRIKNIIHVRDCKCQHCGKDYSYALSSNHEGKELPLCLLEVRTIKRNVDTYVTIPPSNAYCDSCGDEITCCDSCGEYFNDEERIFCLTDTNDRRIHECSSCGE